MAIFGIFMELLFAYLHLYKISSVRVSQKFCKLDNRKNRTQELAERKLASYVSNISVTT